MYGYARIDKEDTTMATKVASATTAARVALAAFVERETKAPLLRLKIGSRAALLREWRRLRPVHDGWE